VLSKLERNKALCSIGVGNYKEGELEKANFVDDIPEIFN
jgi:hypothetical protein